MNSSTATLGRISSEVSQIHAHVEQLEALNAGKLAERKAKEEELLKAQVSQNRALQAQNDHLVTEIATLRKGNDDLRHTATLLENGNDALRRELAAVNAKAQEASGFIQTTLNLTDDTDAADLAVLRGESENSGSSKKHRHRHHRRADEEAEYQEEEEAEADASSSSLADEEAGGAKEEEADDSDAAPAAAAVPAPPAPVAAEKAKVDASKVKDEEDVSDDQDDSDTGSDKDDDDEAPAAKAAKKPAVNTAKIQTGTADKANSGFLRALHRGAAKAPALLELKAQTKHRYGYRRRFRGEDADLADEETDAEADEADAHHRDDGEGDSAGEEEDDSVEEKSGDAAPKEPVAAAELPPPVDPASEKMLTNLKQEIERLRVQNADGVARMEADFVNKHKAADKQMREILAQQKDLNASKASFVETQHRLDIAVAHLQATKGKLEAQMKGLGAFLRNLGHFLLAPATEDPSKLIKAMPALLSQ